MNDLISRQAAIETAVKMFEAWYGGSVLRGKEIRARFDKLPTVDPVKHGEWIVKEKVYPDLPNDSDYRYECSLCGWEDQHNEKMIVPYCWHCGARMDL